MFTAVAAGWSAFTGWASRNPIVLWVIGGLLIITGAKKVIHDIKQEARKAERAAIAVKQAKVKEAVVERVDDIATEERSNADAALEARSTDAHYPDAASVPADLQTIGFRNRGGGPAS